LWIPVLFGIGIGVYFMLSAEPPWYLAPVVTIAAALIWLTGFILRNSPIGYAIMAFGLAFGICAAGATIAQSRAVSIDTTMLSARIGPTTVIGRVAQMEAFPDSVRVVIERPRIASLAAHKTPHKVKIRIRGTNDRVGPGDWVHLRAILSPPSPPVAPGAFDFQRHSYFQGIGAVGFSLGKMRVTSRANQNESGHFGVRVSALRTAITNRILQALPDRRGGVAAALMTGERSAVPEPLLADIRDAGLAHLLAISGLHIGLVAGIIFAVARAIFALITPIVLRYPVKKWAAVAAMLGAFCYAVLAGATLPTQRAFLMIGLALLGVILDRRGLSLRSVAWAAMVILAVQPESLMGASFQMSFAAVIALIAGYEYLAQRRKFNDLAGVVPRNDFWRAGGRYLAGIALTTVIAGAATAPYAIFHFNRIADYGVLANLIAVPVTGLWVMPWAIAAFILMPVGMEMAALIPMGWGIDVIVGVAENVAAWPGAVTLVPVIPNWGIVSVSIGGLWICLWRRPWRLAGIAGISTGLLALYISVPPDILIDGAGRILAIRDQSNNLIVTAPRRARFQREIWTRMLGRDQPPHILPVTGSRLNGRLSCDIQGCLFRKGGLTAAFVRNENAALEDCGHADLIVGLIPIRRKCRTALTIDRFDLWRHGAHAIWMEAGAIRVETVGKSRGRRPWVPKIPSQNMPIQRGN